MEYIIAFSIFLSRWFRQVYTTDSIKTTITDRHGRDKKESIKITIEEIEILHFAFRNMNDKYLPK